MRQLTASLILAALALPAAAGPLTTWEYRTTLRTDQSPIAGPASLPGETAYTLGYNPAFGVITSGRPDWNPVNPAYPSAGFSYIDLGWFTAWTTAADLQSLEVSGQGRYALDVEVRDATGRVGVLTFHGQFEAGWWGWGFAWPVFDMIPSPDGVGAPPQPRPPSGSLWLGRTRYDVRLDYGFAPRYEQNEDGSWGEVWFPVDSYHYRDGEYWKESYGGFYAHVTPNTVPEPATLALAGVGLGGVLLVRRRSRVTSWAG